MPTFISHAAVPLTIGLGLGRNIVSGRLLLAGLMAAVAPDLDVLAFRLGIAYADQLGHRGFSHSLLFAFIVGVLASLFARQMKSGRLAAFTFVFSAAASHGILDMLTNGGMGVAYLWPFSDQRHFFPVQPIQVSPLSLRRLLSPAGQAVARSELLWVWLPACFTLFVLLLVRRRNGP